MLNQDQVNNILRHADHYAQQRYRDSNYGTCDGFTDRKELVRYLESLMRSPSPAIQGSTASAKDGAGVPRAPTCACGDVERQGWVHRQSHCWPFDESASGVALPDGGKQVRVGTIGHVGAGKATLTAAVAEILRREASKTTESPAGVIVPAKGQQ